MKPERPKLLILGADGLNPSLVRRFADEGRLPHLSRLMNEGRFSPLLSTLPPTTFPAWTSFFTGTTPSHHGVADFTVRHGYTVRFTGANTRHGTTWFEHFERCGWSTGIAWFPASYPPLNLSGFHIAGWDSPVTSRGDASFVHPPALHDAMCRRFGDAHLAFDSIDEFREGDDWLIAAARSLPTRIDRRCDMALWLLENRPVDVAAFYFGETDTVNHHFAAICDPGSPRRPDRVPAGLEDTIGNVYAAFDRAVGRLMEVVADDTAVVILSDHGSGGNSDHVVFLNRFLEQAGLLRFKPPKSGLLRASTLRGHLVRHIPPRLRRRLFTMFDNAAPNLIESRIRFGAVDFAHTAAFSEELPYAPSIWFNQLGREPAGTIRFSEREATTRRIEEAARALVFDDGTPVIARIHRREDLHDGPFITRIPDLVLEFNDRGGYAIPCASSNGTPGPCIERLTGEALRGRKGRSLPGGHRREGVLIVRAPRHIPVISGTPNIHDVPALLCALADIPPLHTSGTDAAANPVFTTDEPAYTAAQEQVVAARLARLGYLEE